MADDLDSPKSAYGIDPQSGRMDRPRGASGNSLAALRTALERTLREQKVQFLVIDEVAHIIHQTRGSSKLEIQLDTLKSLVNQCGTQMVLISSYHLYRLVSLSGQLARRSHVLHFERYRQDRPEDVRAFIACPQSFEKMLPALWGGELTRYAEALHENTLGCIGTLSSVLVRAARLAEADGRSSAEALRRALLTEAQQDRILTEILDGEEAINAQGIGWQKERSMSYAISNPRSTLHTLAPIGVGTPEVESLLGYFCRLAVSHSVSVAALCRQVTKAVGWELAEKYTWHVGNIGGIGDSANNWSATLSALTGVEQLDKLTLLSWRDVVCPTSGSMQGHGPSLVEGGRRSARARRRGPRHNKKAGP